MKEASKSCKLDIDSMQNLLVAVSELILNAIVHGNHEDEEKNVYVKVEYDEKNIVVTIMDEGEGFDIDSLPDPTSEENIFKEHGRGIFIVQTLVDEFNYTNTGHGSEFHLAMHKK